MPGRGGVSRGRADAEMIWGEESPGRTDQFEAKLLPRAKLLDLETSGLVGLGGAVPEVDARGERAGLGATQGSAGGATWTRRLSPRHRRAVGTFFAPADSGARVNSGDDE